MWPGSGKSLKNRIALVAGLLFLLGIGLITLFVSRILRADMQEMVMQQQLTTASYIARDIDGKIKLRLDSLQRVALNVPPGLLSRAPELQEWLEDRRAIHTLFPTGLMIIPANGGPPLADTPHLSTRPKSFVDRDWFIGVTSTLRPFISKPLIARATGESALVIAVPLLSRQGTLMGVLAGVTPLTTPGFLDLIHGVRPGRSGSYQLISPEHRLFVLGSDPAIALEQIPATGKDPVVDLALRGARGSRVVPDTAGAEELVTIVDVQQNSWVLLARQPSGDAFEAVTNTMRNTLLMTLFLAIPLLALLLAALNRLLKPFADLARQLLEMAEGSRPMLPVPSHATDEVAGVAESFNQLQCKLLEQELRLSEMAHHDNLTGLPNRVTVMGRLDNELLRLQRHPQGIALLFLDLDAFKPVNDEYGHQVGDLLLIQIAQRLKACVRDMDMVARLGGDEFLILLSATDAPLDAAERVAQKCIESLRAPVQIGDLALSVGVSIGIATTSSKAEQPTCADQLVSNADAAMYRAKTEGRNRYAIFPQQPKKLIEK